MATYYKVGGQADLVAGVLTNIYTVPSTLKVLVSSVIFTNRHATLSRSVRFSVAVAGAADHVKQYIYWDVSIPPLGTLAWTAPLTVGENDTVRARSDADSVSCQVFVQESDAV